MLSLYVAIAANPKKVLKEKVLTKSKRFSGVGCNDSCHTVFGRPCGSGSENLASTYTNGREVGKSPHFNGNIFVGVDGSRREAPLYILMGKKRAKHFKEKSFIQATTSERPREQASVYSAACQAAI